MTSNVIERPRKDFDPCTAYIRLATELRRAGKLQESEDTLRLALSYMPGSLEALIVLAHVLHRRDRELALAGRARGQPVVSNHVSVSPVPAGRLVDGATEVDPGVGRLSASLSTDFLQRLARYC